MTSQNSIAYHALGFFCLMLLLQKSCARQFIVGGTKGWSVPTDNTTLEHNQWAENNRFQIGDSLVFNYPSGQDSVLAVTEKAYNDCETDSPIAKFSDGHTVYTFKQSGAHYFISGNEDSCKKNEKMVVIVLADRSGRYSNSTSPPSPPPSGSIDVIPPSPAPAGENSPPEGSVEINPTPAPQTKPSAASSTFVSLVSSIGAFAASSIIILAF